MMTSSMTSALAVSFLLQLILQTCAGEPVKIFLILDSNAFNKQYGQIFTNSPIQLNHNGESFSPSIPNNVKEAGHKILYISAKFNEDDVEETLTWGAGKSAQDLAKIVTELFSQSKEVFVTVVLPDICLKTSKGYEFVAQFEKKVQESNKNIGVGIPRVKVYLFVDLRETDISSRMARDNLVSDSPLQNTMNSIFFKLEANVLALHSNEEWKKDGLDSVIKILQSIKIQEAEMVIVIIEADCVKYIVKNVADALYRILGTKRREHQRIKIEFSCLPNNRAKSQEEQLSNELIGNLKQNLGSTSIYGARPNVVIHLATSDFVDDVKKKLPSRDSTQLYAKYDNSKSKFLVFDAGHRAVGKPIEAVKSAKELSLQVNCHSNFELNTNSRTICVMPANKMAEAIKDLFKGIDDIALNEKRIELVMYACNSGTTIGQTYVETFLNNLKGKQIDEVISFVGWVSQVNEIATVTVPIKLKFYAEDLLTGKDDAELKILRTYISNNGEAGLLFWQPDRVYPAYEHAIYSRFTVRTKWDGKKYITFPVLPKTEYEVYELNHKI